MSLVKIKPTPSVKVNLPFSNKAEFMDHINSHDCPANNSAEIHKSVNNAPGTFKTVKGLVKLIENEYFLVVNEKEKYKCFSPVGRIIGDGPFYSYVKNAVADGFVHACIINDSASIFVWEFKTRLTNQIKELADKNNGWVITLRAA
ncbi:MAG: hypothetical protein ACJAYB_000047 [Psychromonas sp.]|jgi:hypothetical protein